MNTPIHVLLVEDSPGDARLIQLMLSEARGLSFDLTWVDNLPDGLARLRAGRIDVVLLDLGLPGSTGLDTLQRLFDQGATQVPTLVVLSGLTDEEIAVQALQSGAQDYLVKGQVDSALLVRAIRYAIGRSQADEALRHAHAALQERTAELIAAKERAELANRAKSAFLAHMSHDLRTPLNGILGFAQLLQADRELGERQRTASTAIRQCGEHLLTLINDILDLAKIEAGKIEIVPADVDLRRFLQAVEEIIRVRVAQKPGLAFTCEFSPGLPDGLRVDERRLRQVVLNLLDNAVKFSDRGSVHWRVDWRAPGRLRVEVQDTGVGMGEQQVRRLFQPFEQVSDAQRRSSGTGLGLVISRQFVRLMGGDIEVNSRAGEGSRFAFEIDAPPAAGLLPAPPVAQAVSGYQGPRRRVLVVDDVAEHRALLAGMMQPLGFEMVEAATGAQGLALAQALRPDLVLLDLVMPDLGGIEVMRRLRGVPGLRTLPIVAISASAGMENQRRARDAGANAFLAKPVDLAELQQQVGRLLALRWTDASGRCIEPAAAVAGDPGADMT